MIFIEIEPKRYVWVISPASNKNNLVHFLYFL